jgi:hypothetical protein
VASHDWRSFVASREGDAPCSARSPDPAEAADRRSHAPPGDLLSWRVARTTASRGGARDRPQLGKYAGSLPGHALRKNSERATLRREGQSRARASRRLQCPGRRKSGPGHFARRAAHGSECDGTFCTTPSGLASPMLCLPRVARQSRATLGCAGQRFQRIIRAWPIST